MALPKDTRQKMINLMYLVLTAMLALNVTREVLDAFKTMDDSIQRSNNSIESKNNIVYSAFEQAMHTSDSVKVKPWLDKANAIKAETEQLMRYLQDWKEQVITKSGGYTEENGVKQIKSMDDINTSTELFVTNNKGVEIKKHLQDYVDFILNHIDDPVARENMKKQFPLQIANPSKTEDNPSGDWAYGTFHNIPVIAATAMFSKFQNDVKNSESMALDYLQSQIHAQDYKFDALLPIAVPKTSYALEGQEIEATILLAAYNKSVNPRITSSAGAVDVKDGVGTLKFKASGVGAKTVNGTIYIDKAGVTEKYDYKFDYMVGTAGASLQLDKMNVMYIGVDNPVTLSASGYNIEDVSLNIAGASLKPDGKGKYLVRVSKQGTTDYTITARTREGGSAKVGGGQIRVKYIPPPQATVADKASGLVHTNVAKAQLGVVAKLDQFDFDARFQVTSFRFILIPKTSGGDLKISDNTGPLFNATTLQYIKNSRPGDQWVISNVYAKGPDGRNQPVNSITITLN